jgi:hypothetical protein
MRVALFISLLLALPTWGQQSEATKVQTSGSCSPNILSNQGQVQFTCNTSVDTVTAEKIVSLLNQILKKENNSTGIPVSSDRKLDEILQFLQTQAQQSQKLEAGVQELQQQTEQRHLSEDQKTNLISLLKTEGPQEFYFITATDPETTYFSNEILDALQSAGWKPVPHPPNWPIFERPGQGVQVWVGDVTKAPRAAFILQQSLMKSGIDAMGQNFFMLSNDKIALYVGIKPVSSGPIHQP